MSIRQDVTGNVYRRRYLFPGSNQASKFPRKETQPFTKMPQIKIGNYYQLKKSDHTRWTSQLKGGNGSRQVTSSERATNLLQTVPYNENGYQPTTIWHIGREVYTEVR